jgi:SSS family solute:Na+ symporter
MTDLAQGMILLVAGIGVFLVGIWHLGGFGDFWSLLPQGHRFAFSAINEPADFSALGIFAQDGLANSGAFMLMNQGIIMRFLSMRSVLDARKMAICWTLILMPLAALATSGGGWIARAMVEQGGFETTSGDAFIEVAAVLLIPGVFGFVLAALTAALMSTADTLINASTAIFLNDVYRPYLNPNQPDRHYLRVARFTSFVVVIVGLLLVQIFMAEKSIYSAHGLFTAAVTPPIVVAIVLGILWKRYTPAAAVATVCGGGALIGLSLFAPFDDWFVKPFSFGMGPDSYKFMRALFGLVTCTSIGVVVSLITKPRPLDAIRGLVNGTQLDAMRSFKGGEPNRAIGRTVRADLATDEGVVPETVRVSPDTLRAISAAPGDIVYVNDARWWFGGLRSLHLRAVEGEAGQPLQINPQDAEGARLDVDRAHTIQKLI